MMPPTSTDKKPAASEMRVPARMRLKMSRPSGSAPNQGVAEGPLFSLSYSKKFSGSKGAIHGAITAMHTSSPTKMAATMPTGCFLKRRQHSPQGVRTLPAVCPTATGERGTMDSAGTPESCVMAACSLVADGRVDEAVQHIDHEVDQDEFEREQQHQRLDHRVVTHLHGIDQQAAQAGPVEHRLHEDRAAQQKAELQAHHRDHRYQRIAQRVLEHHAGFAHALGARGAHEIFLDHFDERGAREARDHAR